MTCSTSKAEMFSTRAADAVSDAVDVVHPALLVEPAGVAGVEPEIAPRLDGLVRHLVASGEDAGVLQAIRSSPTSPVGIGSSFSDYLSGLRKSSVRIACAARLQARLGVIAPEGHADLGREILP